MATTPTPSPPVFLKMKNFLSNNKKGVAAVVIVCIISIVVAVVLSLKKKKTNDHYTTAEMLKEIMERANNPPPAAASSTPPTTNTPGNTFTVSPLSSELKSKPVSAASSNEFQKLENDFKQFVGRDVNKTPEYGSMVDKTRNNYQSSGDANVYLEALKKLKPEVQDQPKTMAETANMREMQSQRLWELQKEAAKTSAEVPGVDPNEGVIGGIGDMSMSTYESGSSHVASLIPNVTVESDGRMVEKKPENEHENVQEATKTFVIEGNEQLVDSFEAPNLRQVFSGKRSAIVVFYAERCPACHNMMPAFEKAAENYTKVHLVDMKQPPSDPNFAVWLKVDVAKNPLATKNMGLTATPTVYRITAGENNASPKIVEYDFKLLSNAKKADYRKINGFLEFAESIILPNA